MIELVIFVFFAVLTQGSGMQTNIRTCRDASFCKRFRSWKARNIRPSLCVASVSRLSQDDRADESTATLRLKSIAESRANYVVSLVLSHSSGYVRISVDDVSNLSGKMRTRIPEEDIMIRGRTGAVESSARVVTHHSSKVSVFSVTGLYRVEVTHHGFQVRIFNKFGQLAHVVNSRNNFTFEKFRLKQGDICVTGTLIDMACRYDIDTSDHWVEQSARVTDRKIFGPSAVGLDVEIIDSDALFGLPERTVPFRLPIAGEESNPFDPEDGEFRFFNSDVFNHSSNSRAALYGSIPMITSIHNGGQYASGLVWLNPSETFVSLKRREDRKLNVESSWVSETGMIDMLLFTGSRPQDVLRQFHSILGNPAFPPLFALGFHQSKWGYSDEEEVDDISHDFRYHKIPLDVMWLDIQHTNGKRYMTWNADSFGDPISLTRRLAARGQKLVAIIDPHIKVDPTYYVYEQSRANDFFIKAPDMSADFVGACWPGASSYLDFFRSDVREYWASLFSYSVYNGSSPNLYVWNDMNEPSVFDGPEMTLPRSALHNNGNVEHREIHNIYGQYFHRATFEGLLKRDGEKRRRPFVLSRSFFVGSHRFGPVWTGDNQATWDFLRLSVPMVLSLSISGLSFAGADVGGFFGDPDKELFIRWHQLGAMAYPFYRCHSHQDSKMREPWEYDRQTLDIVRTAILSRYTLLPYWYTWFALHALEGLPIVRPLWFDFMSDTNTCTLSLATEEQIMVGDSLLVRPVMTQLVRQVDIYLPGEGEIWYDFNSPESNPMRGRQTVTVGVTLDAIPVYIRGGSIIPMKMTRRISSQFMKKDPITLRVFPKNGNANGLVYIDDEDSMDYLDFDDFALIQVEFLNGALSYKQIGGKRFVSHIDVEGIHVFGARPSYSTKCIQIRLNPFPDLSFCRCP